MSDERKELKDLARDLAVLTEKGGPLLLLVAEVRDSNRLALRNVRLQIMSLAVLALCLCCLLGLGYYFQRGLTTLTRSEERITDLTKRFTTTESAVTTVKETLEEAPKIVADDNGKLKVVATVRLDESFTAQVAPATHEEKKRATPATASYATDNVNAPVSEVLTTKQVEIPLNMLDAHAK